RRPRHPGLSLGPALARREREELTSLRTPRLTLRPIAPADTEAIVALFADPELSRHHALDLADPAEARAWVARRLAYAGPPGTGEWIFDLAGELVGVGRLKPS